MRARAAVAYLLIAGALAGCAEPDPEGAHEPWGFRLASVDAVDVDCEGNSTRTSCHRFRVTAYNNQTDEALELGDGSPPKWEAKTTEGDQVPPGSVGGPDRLPPRSTATVRLAFDVPNGSTVAHLRYDPLPIIVTPVGNQRLLPVSNYTVRTYEPRVDVEVRDADRTGAPCDDAADSDRCHEVEVQITNDRNETLDADASRSPGSWTGTLADGAEIGAHNVTKAPETGVPPGGTGRFVVEYELSDGELARVGFRTPGMPKTAYGDVPLYG